ncbi:hypothetical protein MNBD_CPR01-583 [hydrothermal vent metagenome]|uniref:Helix-turn-helix domain-containing protein n=1 Tax=hydrothermal vent metagenome TaxID=652676 RepID=A0A3B0V7E2_9ZZZZ
MDEITFDGEKYLSSKRAAKVTGYAKDYVGQLCREGRVTARLVGRNWYVLEESIKRHRFGGDEKKEDVKHQKIEKKIKIAKPPLVKEQIRYIPEEVTLLPIVERRSIDSASPAVEDSNGENGGVHEIQSEKKSASENTPILIKKEKESTEVADVSDQKTKEDIHKNTANNIAISRIPQADRTCAIEENNKKNTDVLNNSEIDKISSTQNMEMAKKDILYNDVAMGVSHKKTSRDVDEYNKESLLNEQIPRTYISYVVNGFFVSSAVVILIVLFANIFNLSNLLSYFMIPQSIIHYVSGITLITK